MKLIKRYRCILFDILFVATFLGGMRDDGAEGIDFVRYVRIGTFFLLFLSVFIIKNQKNKYLNSRVSILYLLFILFSLVTTFWAPQPLFAFWKIFEIITTFFLLFNIYVSLRESNPDYLLNRHFYLISISIIGVLILGLINQDKGLIPTPGSIIPFQLHGSLYSMNANDLGFWSGLLFTNLVISTKKITKSGTILFMLYATILILSQSRIFFVSSIVIIFINFIYTKKMWFSSVFILSLISGALFLGNKIINFFTRGDFEQVKNLHGRTYFWELGFSNFLDDWVVGKGFYTGHRFLNYVNTKTEFSASTFDSTWVDLLVDTGVVGTFIFFTFYYFIFQSIKKSNSTKKTILNVCFLFLTIRSLTAPSFQTFSLFLILLFVLYFTAEKNKYGNSTYSVEMR